MKTISFVISLCLSCLLFHSVAYGQNKAANSPAPEWAKVEMPEKYKGFLGSAGLPEDNQWYKKTLATDSRSIDF